MIHRFSARNYMSITDEVELDFRVPGTTPDLPRFRTSKSRPRVRLPAVVMLVGPNGSGKTTLLRAMRETQYFMTDSIAIRRGETIPVFLAPLSPEGRSETTKIEMDFDASWPVDDKETQFLCRYVLEVGREEESQNFPSRVEHEALHVFPKGRSRRLFERRAGHPVHVSQDLNLTRRDGRVSSIPDNASVISVLGKFDVFPFNHIVDSVSLIQSNIVPGSDPWRLPDDEAVQFYRHAPGETEEMSKMLPWFDRGMKGMEICETLDGPVLGFSHHGLDALVHMPDESSGARRLVRTFPCLNFALESGSVAIMDDFDSKLHSDLASEILRWFQSEERNRHGAQIICSSHNLSLLHGLEKEELFITEKSRKNGTIACGARQISGVRRDEDLQRLYRSGELGGIPTFG